MLDTNLDIIYNKKYLVIVPKNTEELLNGFEYSFGNTIVLNNNTESMNFMIDFINSNNFEQLIFVDYLIEYETIIKSLNQKHEMKIIFTKMLESLSDSYISTIFYGMINLCKNNNFSKIGFLDKNMYEVMKNKISNSQYIQLDIEKETKKEGKIKQQTIGVLNYDSKFHSFYNELSAIKLSKKYQAKIFKNSRNLKKFLKLFKMKIIKSKKENVHLNNTINLHINFAEENNIKALQSMDNNVPCILGNSRIFDDYNYLNENLVLKSDDNINEIVEKIKTVEQNRNEILEEYKKFRTDYSAKSKESIEKFLEYRIAEKEEKVNKNKQPLLSIIVPVYNSDKYLKNCLNSILDAGIDDMEILIINDGSTDNSEKIILKYQRSFPKIIRYIKQKNHGIGSVRNIAIKESRGKYIASVDSDDTIDIEFLDSAVEYLKQDVDVVVYDWATITNREKYKTDASDYIFNNDFWNRYEGLIYTNNMPSVCNKIIKKELFNQLKIKYIEKNFEDLSTIPFIMLKAEKIKYINRPYYEKSIKKQSIETTKLYYDMIDALVLIDERLKKYESIVNVNIETLKYYIYSWRFEEYIINKLYDIPEEEITTYTKYLNKNLKKIMLDVFSSERYKQMLEKLPKKYKEYIEKRNKAIKSNRLAKFIKDAREKNEYYIITHSIIYYGLKDK